MLTRIEAGLLLFGIGLGILIQMIVTMLLGLLKGNQSQP